MNACPARPSLLKIGNYRRPVDDAQTPDLRLDDVTRRIVMSPALVVLRFVIGVRLFEREKRTVTLTHSDEELSKYAEELLSVSARMMEAVADRASSGGTISIGANSTAT